MPRRNCNAWHARRVRSKRRTPAARKRGGTGELRISSERNPRHDNSRAQVDARAQADPAYVLHERRDGADPHTGA
jgi:hypothetical protein